MNRIWGFFSKKIIELKERIKWMRINNKNLIFIFNSEKELIFQNTQILSNITKYE